MLPPLSSQKEFAQRFHDLNMIASQVEVGSDFMENLFSTLQHRAFSGQL
jgi:hypothetical protein